METNKPEGVRETLWRDWNNWCHEYMSPSRRAGIKLQTGCSLTLDNVKFTLAYEVVHKMMWIYFPDTNETITFDDISLGTGGIPTVNLLHIQTALDSIIVKKMMDL